MSFYHLIHYTTLFSSYLKEVLKILPVDEYYAKSRKAMRERGETPPPLVRDWDGIEQSVMKRLEWIRKMKAEQGLDTPK